MAEAIEAVDVDVEAVETVEVDVATLDVVEAVEAVEADEAVEAVEVEASEVEAVEAVEAADVVDAEADDVVASASEASDAEIADVVPADVEAVEVARDPAAYERLKPIVEALIFASPEPLTPKTLFKLLDSDPKEDVETALALLKQDYDRPGGLQLVEVAGGYQIVTRPELHEYVRRLFHERTSQKLSVQALETLAVIAYRQPVTAPEITEIRGVNTSGVLNTLVDRKLVKIVGRKDVVGRPFMYATTRDFLDKFGLNDISDLPKVEDLADVLGFEPPSLDSAGADATALAFDFGDPIDAPSPESIASSESTEVASAESTEVASAESTEAVELSEAVVATTDAIEIAPADDASSDAAPAISADEEHDAPSSPDTSSDELETSSDEDEYR